MEKLPSLVAQLTSSRQQVDTLEKEVSARAKENLLLRQQLQEMTDFAEGLVVTMPADWSLEEQNTALRVTLRMAREDWPGDDDVQKLEIPGEKGLSSLIRMVMAENEEQGRVIRKLERITVELKIKMQELNEKKKLEEDMNESVELVTNLAVFDNLDTNTKSVTNMTETFIQVHSDEAEVVATSRAKLRIGKFALPPAPNTSVPPALGTTSIPPLSSTSIPPSRSTRLPTLPLSLSQLNDEQFCDMQIRMLEAGQELSKKEILELEEMTAKINEEVKIDRYAEEEMILQPCQVTIAGLGWGLTPAAVVRHVREYQGVSMVRVEGDVAIVKFNNFDFANKFRGKGGPHTIEGFKVEVGEVEIMKVDKISSGVEDDVIESSVAVAVRRRGRRSASKKRQKDDGLGQKEN